MSQVDWSSIPVKDRKTKLKSLLPKITNDQEMVDSVNLFEGIYDGLDAVCIGTGPSLLQIPKSKLEEFCKDKAVFCLKSSVLKYPEVADVCITNTMNIHHDILQEDRGYLVFGRKECPYYSPNSKLNPFLIKRETLREDVYKYFDICWGYEAVGGHANSLCNKDHWEEHELNKAPFNRPCGPGILNDTGIHVMVHTGVKSISFIGWDGNVTTKEGFSMHYYDIEREYHPNINVGRRDVNLEALLRSNLPMSENEIIRAGAFKVKEYLASKNIDIQIIAKDSHIDERVERNFFLYDDA